MSRLRLNFLVCGWHAQRRVIQGRDAGDTSRLISCGLFPVCRAILRIERQINVLQPTASAERLSSAFPKNDGKFHTELSSLVFVKFYSKKATACCKQLR